MNERYYFTNENADNIANDYIGTLEGALKRAQELANETGAEVVVNNCYTDEIEDFAYPD